MMNGSAQFIKFSYPIQTLLKLIFIILAVTRSSNVLLVGALASLLGLFRMLKMPKFDKQYLQKVLTNNHGQNLLYIGMGAIGYTNFLFLAPLILYFAYGLLQFYNQKFPRKPQEQISKLGKIYQVCRNNKFYIFEGKARLQILYFIYLLVTIPIDFNRILKCLLMGQYNLLRYRASAESRHAAFNVNSFISNKISSIGFLHSGYNKAINYIHKMATQMPS